MQNLPDLDLSRFKPLTAEAGSLTTKPVPSERAIRRRVERRRFVHLDRTARAIELLTPLPELAESIDGTMSGSVDGFGLLAAVIEMTQPATVQELRVSTLGINEANVTALFALMDAGRVQAIPRFIVSHYFHSVDKAIFEQLAQGLKARGCTVAVARVHAKVQLIHATNGGRYVISGSQNLRSCKSLEVFTVTHDADLYDFHARWMDDDAFLKNEVTT